MLNHNVIKAIRSISAPSILSIMLLSGICAMQAFAQGTTTLRDPLIPGAESGMPFVPATSCGPPAFGSGPIPRPISPGQLNGPTFEPWVLDYPANSIGMRNSGIGLPIAMPIALPPGVVGPMLTPVTPHAPSTPGPMPAYMRAPAGFINPAGLTTIPPGGGYVGNGGYYTSVPKIRRSGQVTQQFEQRGNPSFLGGSGHPIIPGTQNMGMDILQQFGPLSGLGVINGVPTGVGYNRGLPGTNNANFLSTIDFGGGFTTKINGVKIPLGKTIQDCGGSAMRRNATLGLTAHQSTEFGQGLRGTGVSNYKTTDFGFPFTERNLNNVGIQNGNAALPPKGIETNF